jgi:hypothetical protein
MCNDSAEYDLERVLRFLLSHLLLVPPAQHFAAWKIAFRRLLDHERELNQYRLLFNPISSKDCSRLHSLVSSRNSKPGGNKTTQSTKGTIAKSQKSSLGSATAADQASTQNGDTSSRNTTIAAAESATGTGTGTGTATAAESVSTGNLSQSAEA